MKKNLLYGIFLMVLSNFVTAQTQIGSPIIGNNNDDSLGQSVSLSSNGSILAIGAPTNNIGPNNGYAEVYKRVLVVQRGTKLVQF